MTHGGGIATQREPGRLCRFARATIPSALTIARLCLAPLIVELLIHSHSDGHSWAAGILLAAAGLTDFFDGRLARRWRVESQFGKFADQFADKLVIAAVILLLIRVHRLPWAGIVLLAVRSVAKTMIVAAGPRPLKFAPSFVGKLSASIIYLALCGLLITTRGTFWPLALYWIGIAVAVSDVPLKLATVLGRSELCGRTRGA